MFELRECRPILPAINMKESLEFYADLGFRVEIIEPLVAALSQGAVSFLLQVQSPQEGLSRPVMTVTIPSLREWWIKVKLLDLASNHRVKSPREPTWDASGKMIGHLYDPSGVDWQFREPVNANVRRNGDYKPYPVSISLTPRSLVA